MTIVEEIDACRRMFLAANDRYPARTVILSPGVWARRHELPREFWVMLGIDPPVAPPVAPDRPKTA